MNKMEKAHKISEMDGITLLTAYDFYVGHFDPLDKDFIDTYELIKAEILRRLNNK